MPYSVWLGHMKAVCRDHARWFAEVGSIGARVLRGEVVSERDRSVFWHLIVARETLGLPRDWKSFRAVAMDAARSLGLPNEEPTDATSTLIMIRRAPRSPGGVYVGEDGMMRLGFRQSRDLLQRVSGARRARDVFDALDASPARMDVDADPTIFSQTDEMEDAIDAMDAADLLHRVRTVIAGERARAMPGSVAAVALEHFEQLQTGEVSVRDLASRTGFSFGAIARQHRRTRDLVARCVPTRIAEK
ncbi:MAG: hypothetical protein IT459_04305 [Planctomycetes bacterium]|nr:hypothetical protein [Planctomycetota bacterium]